MSDADGRGFVVGRTGWRLHFAQLSVILHGFLEATKFSAFFSLSGGSEDGEQWAYQPEGGRAGWLSGTVQDQTAYSSQQTDESLLWTAGESKKTTSSTSQDNSSLSSLQYW